MADRLRDDVGGAVGVAREGAGNEVGARGQRDDQRIERAHAGAARRELGVPVGLGSRRGLPLGHAVDVVVHHDVGEVHVASASVQEVIAADRVAVAVAAGHQHGELGACHLQAGGRRERAAVHTVKAVTRGVCGDARGAADARHHGDVLRAHLHHGERLGNRAEHRVIAAARTPDGFVGRFVVFCRQRCGCLGGFGQGGCLVHCCLQSRMTCASSPGRIGSGPGR